MGLRSWYLWKGGRPFAALFGRLVWPRATAGVLVLHDDHVLAVDTGDYLMLPVGGLEAGESFVEAARREAREETGVDVAVGECVDEGTNAYGGVERLFVGEPTHDTPLAEPSWEGEPTWIPVADARERRWRFDRPVGRYLDTVLDGDDPDSEPSDDPRTET
jgi:8-oxo-dGTP pyrophosphatase MutT (NUDIX family)